MIKLITTDLDGTLVDDLKRIPEDFWEVQKKLEERGILFAVASGRQYYSLADKFDSIKDNILFLAENGAYVKYKNEEIHVDPMSKSAANQLIETARKIEGAFPVLCGRKSAYIENTNEDFLKEIGNFYKKFEIIEDLKRVEDVVFKVTLCDFMDAERNSYLYYKDYEKDYKIAVGGKIWLDISNPNADKGNAIKKIQEKFGITFEETVVFGDFLNDLEMMKVAHYSYAMKNAHPEIIKASRFVTEFDNNNNGVLKTIKKLLLPE